MVGEPDISGMQISLRGISSLGAPTACSRSSSMPGGSGGQGVHHVRRCRGRPRSRNGVAVSSRTTTEYRALAMAPLADCPQPRWLPVWSKRLAYRCGEGKSPRPVRAPDQSRWGNPCCSALVAGVFDRKRGRATFKKRSSSNTRVRFFVRRSHRPIVRSTTPRAPDSSFAFSVIKRCN